MTVTVTVKLVPGQFAAEGVTVYVAVCGIDVGLVNEPLMLVPFPAAPIIPPVVIGANQV